MKVIALDIGVGKTGYSIWENNFLIGIGTLKVNTKYRSELSTSMAEQILNLIKVQKPGYLAVEDYAFSSGFFNMDQAEALGIVKHFVIYSTENMKLFLVPITTAKKIVTGSGKGKKSAVKKSVKELGFVAGDVHQYDSIAIYLAFKSLSENPTKTFIKRSVSGQNK
jgi:Holliday junction resolvasome RuvABC endonuclease subunit